MGNPGVAANSPVPGLAAVTAGDHSSITDTFSRPWPYIRVLGALLKNRSPVRMRTIGMKPTQQPEHHSFGPVRMECHWLIVTFERMWIFGIRVKAGFSFPRFQIFRSKAS